jgi:proteasome accessory factor B
VTVDKLERLLNLTAVLLETTVPMSAAQLRRQVPGYPASQAAFRRSFERDKDDLREMGVPLRVVPVPGTDPPLDGYDIDADEYYLTDPRLEPDELAALHLAASTVRIDGARGQEALWKLGGVLAGDGVEVMASLPGDPNLGPVFEAVTSRRVIEFDYRGERRRVDPHRLDFRRGRWYLTAGDHARRADRNFRLDRIEGPVVVLGEPEAFARPDREHPGAAAPPWQLGGDDEITVRLRVDADQAAWARTTLGDEAVAARHPDGAITFELVVTNRAALRSFALTFLDHAVIEDPPALRQEMIAWLEDLAS